MQFCDSKTLDKLSVDIDNVYCTGIRVLLSRDTDGKNIIAATKIRNNYGAIQSFIFPILR